MKKIVLSLIISILTVLCIATASFAADVIEESPNVKIVIDGKTGTYEDVPLLVNERTMLPLRALLVNLGVQNDDKHIIWNDADQSVTVIKDTKNIKLTINNSTALVDGSSVTLDAAPIIYKNKTYIPARFVAQSLGKKVVWEGSSSTVLIRDISQFNNVKDVLDKSNAAMKAVNKFKYTADAVVSVNGDGQVINTTVNANNEFDVKNKLIHAVANTEVMGQKVVVEMYIGSDAMYMKNPETNKWQQMKLEGELMKQAFESSTNSAIPQYTEAMCAGLIMEENAAANEIVLKGDVYMDELLKAAGLKLDGIQMSFDKMYIEMTLDKNTYLSKKAYMDIVITMEMMGQRQTISEKINCTYSDYNGNFQIAIPEEAKAAEPIAQ